MRDIIKTVLGLGVIIGMVLLAIGFFLFLFEEPYRLCIADGTLLCALGIGYANTIEEGEDDEVR